MAPCNSIPLQFSCYKTASVLKALQVCGTLRTKKSPDEGVCNDSIIPYLDYFQHLHSSDFAITVQVIHVEGPVEFLLKATTGCDGQSADELSKIDGPVSIFVKSSEGVLCKFRCIAIREELQI